MLRFTMGILPLFTRILFLTLYLTETINAACPEKCRCENHYIDCTSAGLDVIPWDLPDPVGLQTLQLQRNNIHELLARIVSYLNLQVLDLSSNRMLSVEDNVFQSLVNLKTLILSHNKLQTLSIQTFKGLTSLQVLDLSNNNLRSIEENPFSDLGKLQKLVLSTNSIAAVSPIAFLGLVNLRSLSMNNNRLKEVPRESLVHVSNLHHLMLNDNDIKEIPADSLADVEVLQTLTLDGNKIRTISENAFSDASASQIRVLSLRNNDLSMVPSEVFTRLKSVQTIVLSGNPVVVIDPDAFKGLEELESISLESMPALEVIRSFSFSELQNLKSVAIHSNPKLRSIEKDAFLASASVRHVDLHSNALETLDSELFNWENLIDLDLSFNKWNCDCHLDFLPAVLRSLRNKSRASQALCAKPHHLESKAVIELSPDHFQCDVQVKKLQEQVLEEQLMIGIIAGVSCLLLAVMVFLMYRSRHTMFGMGPMPVRYRAPRSTLGSGHTARSHGERDGASDDHLTIADNEEQPPETTTTEEV